MNVQQIQAALEPYLAGSTLNDAQLEQVRVYLDLLLKWNAKTNLTAVRDPEEIVTRHFGESFFAAKAWLRNEKVSSVIDFGSGAGFPGLPMAIFSPQTQVTLIESQNKKATFLKEAVRRAALKNVAVFAGRGEDFAGKASLVTLRAVENFSRAVDSASGLIEPGGRLGLMIAVGQESTLPKDFKWEVGNPVPGAAGRILAIGSMK